MRIPYVTEYTFLGVTIYRSLSGTLRVKLLKTKLGSFVSVIRMVSGASSGSSVSALLKLYEALFVGILLCNLLL